MSEKMTGTDPISSDRRSFLKTGAIAAAPLAALAPAAALAGDGSAAKLARLEDQRAIEGLERAFLRRLNGKGAGACGEFFACGKAPALGEGLRVTAEASGEEPEIAFADDGHSATLRRPVQAEREVHFTGDTTIEQMARLQGHGSHRHAEDRTLVARFIKNKQGWTIDTIELA